MRQERINTANNFENYYPKSLKSERNNISTKPTNLFYKISIFHSRLRISPGHSAGLRLLISYLVSWSCRTHTLTLQKVTLPFVKKGSYVRKRSALPKYQTTGASKYMANGHTYVRLTYFVNWGVARLHIVLLKLLIRKSYFCIMTAKLSFDDGTGYLRNYIFTRW